MGTQKAKKWVLCGVLHWLYGNSTHSTCSEAWMQWMRGREWLQKVEEQQKVASGQLRLDLWQLATI